LSRKLLGQSYRQRLHGRLYYISGRCARQTDLETNGPANTRGGLPSFRAGPHFGEWEQSEPAPQGRAHIPPDASKIKSPA
jgi:hypothetical protein